MDNDLPEEIEHIYPDYSLYPELTKERAFGKLTSGCPRQCKFCHVKSKEGTISIKHADLSEFWNGQKNITLCDPNFFACPDWKQLMQQLIESKAKIDFNQGIDVRVMTEEKVKYLNRLRLEDIHLAWDRPQDDLKEKFQMFSELFRRKTGKTVYVLVNFDSTIEEDLYRIYTLRDLGYDPFVMVYDKENADYIHKDLARWVNMKATFKTVKKFEDYRR